jgi:iron complex transport system substrate-binding protein
MKIISLIPSATEIVFALGLGEDLEGVTEECDYPADATTKPVVSRSAIPSASLRSAREIDDVVRGKMAEQQPLYTLDRDLIRRVQPDIILTQDLCRVCAVPSGQVERALEELGTTDADVVSLDPHSLEEILSSITRAGRLLEREAEADRLVDGLRNRIDAVRNTASRLPTIRAFALEWADPPFVGGHWIPEMVRISGGTNLLNAPQQPSRPVTWREIADAAPEVVVFMPCGYYLEEAVDEGAQLFEQPEFASTPAAHDGAVFAVDATSYFSRPGPRVVDGLEILAWAIHPDAFPEPAPGSISRLGG